IGMGRRIPSESFPVREGTAEPTIVPKSGFKSIHVRPLPTQNPKADEIAEGGNVKRVKPRTSAIIQDTLAVILAGGQGERLYPLTKHRAKPAVPFGGIYRIIDFALSNCINSQRSEERRVGKECRSGLSMY